MKKYIGLSIFMTTIVMMTLGCSQTMVAVSNPSIVTSEKPLYTAQLEPVASGENFVAFVLTVMNAGTDDVYVDWNQSRYIHNGTSRGGFVFAGMDPAAIKAGTIRDDRIAAGGTLEKHIVAHKLVAYAKLGDSSITSNESGLSGGPMPAGENGILLVLKRNGERILEKMTVDIQFTNE